MILSAQTIRQRCKRERLIDPFHERTVDQGLTFGLSPAGYDIRLGDPEGVTLPPHDYQLGVSLECFFMPRDLIGNVCDKSTWARQGVTLQNTIIEPGWRGYLTLEFINHSPRRLFLPHGIPVAQIVFNRLDKPTGHPYRGKYQDQPAYPVHAIKE